ncbi:glutathione S-transferase [Roseomonas sp. JC162]|uniref:Glutathione S-transferase n=1 Tax=Neoroseomonas marina TaxID=1232220 RepID=A0A848ECD7_9PROT|nr:glutathione S-transferase N-terminal domain-containing protein [Neoroseomonas marina]NMJ41123.1 glutathione S-transferase [Neoroseomonas marina]
MSLLIHVAPGTCALATLIALEEAGADYTARRVDFAAGEQRSPGFLAVNPKGRVPALVIEDGVLTETPALLTYVAQRFPAAGLAPFEDSFAFARMQEFNAYLCSTVHIAHAHRMRGHRWVDDPDAMAAMQRKVPENMAACFDLIETTMLRGPWVLGDRYSLADGYLHTIARWLPADGVDPARFPRVADHGARMAARPAVQRALARESGG